MRRSQISDHPQVSKDAFYIIAHAKFQKDRGKNPSESYKGELNPRKALTVALAEICENQSLFQVHIGLKNIGGFSKFTDAFKLFFSKIIEQLKQGTSVQYFETSNFIVYKRKGFSMAMDFYGSRDLAYDIGLLAGEGEFQDNIGEPPIEIIENAYAKVATEYLESQFEQLSSILVESVLNY